MLALAGSKVQSEWRQYWDKLREHGQLLAEHDVARAASAIAFHTFFSLVPALAITGWVAHELTQSAGSFVTPLLDIAPKALLGLADSEFMRLGESADAVLPPLSIATFLWLASGGCATAMRVFEHLFGTPRRNWLKRRLMALAFVVGAVIIIALAIGMVVGAIVLGSIAAGVAAVALPLLTVWLLVGVFYRYATKRKEGRKPMAFRGAAVTVLLWIIVTGGFSIYVRELASYSKFYGGLATVVVILVWLWLMSFALLAGGALNALLEKRATPSP